MGDAAVGVGDAGRGGDVRGESGTIDAGGCHDGGEGAVGGNTGAGGGGDAGGESGTIRSSSCSDDSNSAHAAQCQSISMSSLTAAR